MPAALLRTPPRVARAACTVGSAQRTKLALLLPVPEAAGRCATLLSDPRRTVRELPRRTVGAVNRCRDAGVLDRGVRLSAGVALAALPATSVGSLLRALASERGGRCLAYGEGCSAVPDALVWSALLGSALLGLLAVALPRGRSGVRPARCLALLAQLTFQALAAAAILSYS